MVKVKFCGMTNLDDCLAAVDLGVDLVGFVFYRKSPRCVAAQKVRSMTKRLQGKISTVGVFVGDSVDAIRTILDFCDLDFAQVYDRTPGFAGIEERMITVCPIKDAVPEEIPSGLVLFDSSSPAFGGSGIPFDTGLLKGHSALQRAFVAGGVSAGNVHAVLSMEPYGIDLVTGVEESRGNKDLKKMEEFMKRVRSYTP